MADLPSCFNFRRGTCERSDMTISEERDDCWVLLCRTCKSIQVSSKPDQTARARYRVQLERYESIRRAREERGRRTIYG